MTSFVTARTRNPNIHQKVNAQTNNDIATHGIISAIKRNVLNTSCVNLQIITLNESKRKQKTIYVSIYMKRYKNTTMTREQIRGPQTWNQRRKMGFIPK